MSYNLTRPMIYALKRQFPLAVDVYFPDAPSLNLSSGAMTLTSTKVSVRRAILMPDSETRSSRITRSYIRHSISFVMGGYHDTNMRIVLIDEKDIPDIHTLDGNCWLIIEHRRYEVKSVQTFEDLKVYEITCTHLQGAQPYEQHTATVKHKITVAHTADSEIV